MTSSRMTTILAALALAAVLGGCKERKDPGFQGWVEADMIFVSPDESGRVVKLNVREGDEVKPGDQLYSVDDDLQQADLNQNNATLANAQQTYDRAASLSKTGSGTQALTGGSNYTGGTTVNGGTLRLQNVGVAAGNVAIASGATLEFNVDDGNPNTLSSVLLAGTTTFAGNGTILKTGADRIALGGIGGAPVNVAQGIDGLVIANLRAAGHAPGRTSASTG